MDAWSEAFRPDLWWRAFAEEGLDPAFYARRERAQGEILPWEHIDSGVRKDFLWAEYQKALRGETTPNCRQRCVGCGIRSAFKSDEGEVPICDYM